MEEERIRSKSLKKLKNCKKTKGEHRFDWAVTRTIGRWRFEWNQCVLCGKKGDGRNDYRTKCLVCGEVVELIKGKACLCEREDLKDENKMDSV